MKVRARLLAILDAVAEAPPPQFSGGGQWEAMHGEMGGYFEVRAQGPTREQFRLFCVLERAEPKELRRRGLRRPAIAVVTGMRKAWMTTFTPADYRRVRIMGDDYLGTVPAASPRSGRPPARKSGPACHTSAAAECGR